MHCAYAALIRRVPNVYERCQLNLGYSFFSGVAACVITQSSKHLPFSINHLIFYNLRSNLLSCLLYLITCKNAMCPP